MELSPAAEARVRAAIKAVNTDLSYIRLFRSQLKALKKFAAAWDALPVEARWQIECRLADRAGDVEPDDMDVGLVAQSTIAAIRGKQGERPHALSVKVAVGELYKEYVDAGGSPQVGNRTYRDSEGRDSHPTCRFVAEHLLRLFPDVFKNDLASALRRADSHLRDLARSGELTTRKKTPKSA